MVVGISNHVKDTDVVGKSVHVPLNLKGACESEDLAVVGKGKMPLPGINVEVGESDDLGPVELEFCGTIIVENEVGLVPAEDIEFLEPDKLVLIELTAFSVTEFKLIELLKLLESILRELTATSVAELRLLELLEFR